MPRLANYVIPVLWVLGLSMTARAQETDATERAAAERRFQEGTAALNAGRFEEARVALDQAFQLKPSIGIAWNLALAEEKLGRFVPAARHLAFFFRYRPSPKQGEFQLLKRVEAHVGRFNIDVEPNGASITVDNEVVGPSPLLQPIYVEPGTHTIHIWKPAFQDFTQTYSVAPGESVDIKFALRTAGRTNPVPNPIASSPAPVPVPGAAPKAGDVTPQHDDWHQTVPGSNAKTVAVLAAGGLGVAALAAGVVLRLEAVSAQNRRDELADEIRLRLGPAGCPPASTVAACSDILVQQDRRNDYNAWANRALWASGISAVAAASLYFLWPSAPVHASVAVADVSKGLSVHVGGTF